VKITKASLQILISQTW